MIKEKKKNKYFCGLFARWLILSVLTMLLQKVQYYIDISCQVG